MKRLLLLLFLFSSQIAFSQILTFDFAGLSGNEASANSNFNDANLTSSTITRGSGVSASGNSNRFNSNGWTTSSSISTNDYLEFTVTPNANVQFSVTSIDINHQRSGTGPTIFALRSSLDSYAADLATFTNGDVTSTQSNSFSSLSISNQTSAVTFRIYGYDAEGGSGSWGPGDFSGNDIIVNGSTSAIGASVGFDATSSSETETDASFNTTIPVTLMNYGGTQVDLSVAVTGGTAEAGDYTLNTTSLSFTADGTMNVSIDINNDADAADETIELTITETSATGVTITTAIHTITITDDDLPTVFINEFHYNDNGADANEFIEIALISSFFGSLSDFQVTLYNGNGGTSYNTQTLNNFTVGNTTDGFTFYTWEPSSIQNGNPDGFALSYQGNLIEFISYGGTFTATNGDANGETSTDVGVTEGDSTQDTESIQRIGDCLNEACPTGLTWTGPITATSGAKNTNQNLPIELVNFQANKINQGVLLKWQTLTEVNNDYMAVERSSDARNFEEIGRVQGAGTTTEVQHYNFIDEKPFISTNYYRLLQVDFDGHITYHEVLAVNVTKTNTIQILPNPVNDFTTLQFNESLDTESNIMIYDMMGKVVFETTLNAGQSNIEINLSFLANGTYIIRLGQANNVITEKFVKQ